MPVISLIAAIDENNALGGNGNMLWHLPKDLKHFKAITEGHTVIMGHTTFNSLPGGALVNRRNIVISRNKSLQLKDCEIFSSIEETLTATAEEDEIFFIGGGKIFRETLKTADKLYITHIHHMFKNADTYFPAIDASIWKVISKEENYADKENPYNFSFTIYIRNS